MKLRYGRFRFYSKNLGHFPEFTKNNSLKSAFKLLLEMKKKQILGIFGPNSNFEIDEVFFGETFSKELKKFQEILKPFLRITTNSCSSNQSENEPKIQMGTEL